MLKAFPKRSGLAKMLSFKMEVRLDEIESGREGLGITVYELIEWTIARNRLRELIISSHAHNPSCPELKSFCHILGILSPAYNLLSPSHFDLDSQVRSCIKVLKEATHGIVGFSINCNTDDYDLISTHLCNRIRSEWGEGKTDIHLRLKLSPTVNASDIIHSRISTFKNSRLKKRHIILPIQIDSHSKKFNDEIDILWGKVTEAFNQPEEYCLILLFSSSTEMKFPEGIVNLKTVCFEDDHVSSWIRSIVGHKEWRGDFINKWEEKFIDMCQHNNSLHIPLVYSHLEELCDYLKTEQMSPEKLWEEFYCSN